MREERLLERIARWDEGSEERRNLTSTEILIASVMRHLQRILNTRQGSVQIDPRFGVPDFTNLASAFTASVAVDIENEISAIIQRYEPRLRSPRLHMLQERPDVLSLTFELSGKIMADQSEVPVRLSTSIGSHGRISVSR
jgi:type VI secretion system protein